MSAITGIFFRKGESVDPQLMKKMNDKLSHRGVDGSHIWVEGSVGLGHQMLHTTPESLHEKLPYIEEDLVITADARIDNREELANELDIADVETVSDSYFILKAYGRWGEDCPDKLLGDFAFAIWDRKKEILFCARDHMGVKPFYYYVDEEMFVFGTEIKALFEVGGVPREVNDLKIGLYLKQVKTDKNLTFYNKIFCLSAASIIIINQIDEKVEKYWKLEPESSIKFESEEEYKKVFLKIFTEAVECRLRSAFPIGFELSGGLDSSSVVSMARNILDKKNDYKKIETFSMIFNEFPQVDEQYYIDKVNKIDGISSNLIISDKISPLHNIENIFWNQEQPFITPNMAILSNMYHQMGARNIRIVLSGQGGDQTVSLGKKYFIELTINKKWKTLVKELILYSKITGFSFPSLFLNNVILTFIPIFIKQKIKNFLLSLKLINCQNNISILNKNFENKIERSDYFKNKETVQLKNIQKAKENHYLEISIISNQSTLEMINKLGSSVSMETRCPFLDKRLVEFCYAIPTEMKIKNGWNRYIQRISLEDILPKEIQWRPLKKFFSLVFIKNLLLFEKNRLNKIFISENRIIEDYVNLGQVVVLYDKYKKGNKNIQDSRNLWLVTILNLWLNQYNT